MFKNAYAMFVEDFKRFFKILNKELKNKALILFFFMFILALLEVTSILSMSFLAMSVAAPEAVKEYSWIKLLFHYFPSLEYYSTDPRKFAFFASTSVVFLTLLKNCMGLFVGVKTTQFGEAVSLYGGKKILHHFLYSPYIWHLSGDSSTMFQALGYRSFLGAMLINLMNVYTYAITAIALFIMLIQATPLVILGIVAITGCLAAFLYRALKGSIDRNGMITTKASAEENKATLNAMHGIREVIIYRQQEVFFDKFAAASLQAVPARSFLGIASAIPSSILETIGFAIIPASLFFMIAFYNSTMFEIAGTLTMIMLISWRVLPLLNRSLSNLISVRSIRPMAHQCIERLELIQDSNYKTKVEPDPNYHFAESIELDDVCFRYPNAHKDALEHINLKIPKGKKIGLIGPSGSGKSTIASILSGILDINSGKIKVDKQALNEAQLAAYTMQVGYVPQSPYILRGTLAENVAFSEWGKPYDEQKVWDACHSAALDIVDTHPSGINIQLGENGAGLSGGQAQRVSIARVLYANPSLLILDEATSALDQGTEAAIMQTINNLPNDITVVIIAHRLSTVATCDHIVWLENGKIVQEGKASELIPLYENRLLNKS